MASLETRLYSSAVIRLVWPLEPTTLSSYSLSSHRSRGSWYMTFSICHMLTWSSDQSVIRLNGWWPLTINLHLVNFGSHRPREVVIYRFYSLGDFIWPRDHRSSLPSVLEKRVVEVQILPILIFNERSRIHIIILLQSVAIQFCRLFWNISYYKVRQSKFITKCDKLLLESAPGITKCDILYYSVSGITKWDCYYKVRRDNSRFWNTACRLCIFYKTVKVISSTTVLKLKDC